MSCTSRPTGDGPPCDRETGHSGLHHGERADGLYSWNDVASQEAADERAAWANAWRDPPC